MDVHDAWRLSGSGVYRIDLDKIVGCACNIRVQRARHVRMRAWKLKMGRRSSNSRNGN
jgi:hypothetical protein